MRRKNLIAKKRVKKNLLGKDLKINKIYTQFKDKIYKNIKNEKFAVAVSGGSDSLCLVYLSQIYAAKFKNKVWYLIVDHNLRKESGKEALKVKEILNRRGIKSNILRWKGKIPSANIQSKARNMRYSLIHEYCLKNKINYLVTAHHMDDQIENFFIRLFRGSGLTGLSSMSESSDYNDNLKIIRPLLNFKKVDLKYVTLKYFKTYVHDYSNDDEKYLRVRVRKHRKSLEKEGLNTDKIIKTVNNLLSANKALNFYKNKALYKYVTFQSKNKCLINEQIFLQEAGEIIFKCFADILSLVSGTYYPPRSKKIIRLIDHVKKSKFSRSTLGGCIIEKRSNFISITKEIRIKKTLYQPVK